MEADIVSDPSDKLGLQEVSGDPVKLMVGFTRLSGMTTVSGALVQLSPPVRAGSAVFFTVTK